ncbi:hypothetical protein IMZ48_32810 [Candidatus Bathyarchaeota archaeon]|nr:hypothetical protein [Candidatus Bathyarchaeota archaeon]
MRAFTDLDRHCVAAGEEEGASEGGAAQCDKVDRDYDVKLRIGLIFAVLATSAVGMSPLYLE